jgi:hypothetical protein
MENIRRKLVLEVIISKILEDLFRLEIRVFLNDYDMGKAAWVADGVTVG